MNADNATVGPDLDLKDSEEEIRQLITDLRDAARDGPGRVRRGPERLAKIVDEQCVEFEKRAEAAPVRLNAI